VTFYQLSNVHEFLQTTAIVLIGLGLLFHLQTHRRKR
jgi:hypothetical protein